MSNEKENKKALSDIEFEKSIWSENSDQYLRMQERPTKWMG